MEYLAGSMLIKMTTVVKVENLKKYFPIGVSLLDRLFSREKKFVRAVDGVTFDIKNGEIFGLVGESGCGKTTCGKLIMKLIEPTSGRIRFRGQDITDLDDKEMRKYRSKMQIVFQDTATSLNPRKTIYYTLSQPFLVHNLCERHEVKEAVLKLLELVKLTPAEEFIERYPHELSGGQKQRVNIARALAVNPDFIVFDEPTSALDVSTQAGIINLIRDITAHMHKEFSSLFITHDLAVIRSIANRVGVMYLGKIVELASTQELFNNPLHPYTRALLSATPVPNPQSTRSKDRIILKGDIPSPINPPMGCRFHPRCPYAQFECSKVEPKLVEVSNHHFVACSMMA